MKLLMCDDVAEHFETAEKYIKENEPYFTVEYFDTPAKLMQALPTAASDTAAVLMDIEIGKENGIASAEHISLLYPFIKIIFLTSYSLKYCEEVFLTGKNLTPFVLVDKSNLTVNLRRALDKLRLFMSKEEQSNTLILHSKKEDIVIDTKKTKYLESDGHEIIFINGGAEKKVRIKLSEVAAKLPEYFVQCHKSFFVNMLHIVSYNSKEIELDDGRSVPISRNFCQSFRNAMLEFKCE